MNEKYMWYKHWCNAVDRKREYLVANDYYNAMKWADVALSISVAFAGKFDMRFSEYIKEVMGV